MDHDPKHSLNILYTVNNTVYIALMALKNNPCWHSNKSKYFTSIPQTILIHSKYLNDCVGTFNEISGPSESHLHWKNLGTFLMLRDQTCMVLWGCENHPNFWFWCILGGENKVRRYSHQFSVQETVLFYPATVSRMCKSRSNIIVSPISCSAASLSKNDFAFVSHPFFLSVLPFSIKSIYKKQGQWGVSKNLKERGRGPFNLEISKTYLICNSDLRCFHLYLLYK